MSCDPICTVCTVRFLVGGIDCSVLCKLVVCKLDLSREGLTRCHGVLDHGLNLHRNIPLKHQKVLFWRKLLIAELVFDDLGLVLNNQSTFSIVTFWCFKKRTLFLQLCSNLNCWIPKWVKSHRVFNWFFLDNVTMMENNWTAEQFKLRFLKSYFQHIHLI